MAHEVLLNNVSADTTSDAYKSLGGPAWLIISADDFGGGAVTVEVQSKNATSDNWVIIPNGSFTEATAKFFQDIPRGHLLHVTFLGSSGAENVFVDIVQTSGR